MLTTPNSTALTPSINTCSALSLFSFFTQALFRNDTCPNLTVRDDIIHAKRMGFPDSLKSQIQPVSQDYKENPSIENAMAFYEVLIKIRDTDLQISFYSEDDQDAYSDLVSRKYYEVNEKIGELEIALQDEYKRLGLRPRFNPSMQDVIAKLKNNLAPIISQEKIDIASLVKQRIISTPVILDVKVTNTGTFQNGKITIYPGNSEVQQQLVLTIEKIIQLDLVSAIPIMEVLQHKDFKIAFATHAEMINLFGQGSNNKALAGGMFASINMMFLPLDMPLDITTISHEFLHAYAHNGMQQPACNNNKQTMLSIPYYTSDAFEHYKTAINSGINRIQDLKKIWIKNKNGKQLSHKEKLQLEEAKTIAKSCLIEPYRIGWGDRAYQQIIERGWQPDKKGFIYNNADLEELGIQAVELMNLNKIGDIWSSNIKAVDPLVHFFLIAKLKQNEVTTYNKALETDPITALGEIEAHIISHLSNAAMQFFFPELVAIRRQFQETCFPSRKTEQTEHSHTGNYLKR